MVFISASQLKSPDKVTPRSLKVVTRSIKTRLYRMTLGYSREIVFEVFQPMWSSYLNVTDRRTDGRTDRRDDLPWQFRAMRTIAR